MKLFVSLLLAVLSVSVGLWLGVKHITGAMVSFDAQLAEVLCALVGISSFVYFTGAVAIMNIRRMKVLKSRG